MDRWKIAVMGDGGVGKTALAVQVRFQHAPAGDFMCILLTSRPVPSLHLIASLVRIVFLLPCRFNTAHRYIIHASLLHRGKWLLDHG